MISNMISKLMLMLDTINNSILNKFINISKIKEVKFWQTLYYNSSLEMLVFNLWRPKMLRSVPLAGSKG